MFAPVTYRKKNHSSIICHICQKMTSFIRRRLFLNACVPEISISGAIVIAACSSLQQRLRSVRTSVSPLWWGGAASSSHPFKLESETCTCHTALLIGGLLSPRALGSHILQHTVHAQYSVSTERSSVSIKEERSGGSSMGQSVLPALQAHTETWDAHNPEEYCIPAI